jgi:hypothetical protein
MYGFLYDELVKSIDEELEKDVLNGDLFGDSENAVKEASERRMELMRQRVLKPNLQGQTPLAYAVSLNNTSMFLQACSKKQDVMWEFGPVICFKMPLVRPQSRFLVRKAWISTYQTALSST